MHIIGEWSDPSLGKVSERALTGEVSERALTWDSDVKLCIAMQGVSMCSPDLHITESIRKVLWTHLKREIVILEILRKFTLMDKIRSWIRLFSALPQLAVYSPVWIVKIKRREREGGRNQSVLLKPQSKGREMLVSN